MRYNELYNQFKLELNQINNKVSAYYSIKYNENNKKIAYLNENKKKSNMFLLISMAITMVLFGIVYSFVSEYSKLVYLWYYAIIPVIIILSYWIWNIIINIKLNKYNEKVNKIEDESIKKEYENINNKIYEVCLKIICLNEYYDELINTNDSEFEEKWNKIISLRRESIDRNYNYITTIDNYTEYLNNFIEKYGER